MRRYSFEPTLDDCGSFVVLGDALAAIGAERERCIEKATEWFWSQEGGSSPEDLRAFLSRPDLSQERPLLGDGCPHGGITRDCPVCSSTINNRRKR